MRVRGTSLGARPGDPGRARVQGEAGLPTGRGARARAAVRSAGLGARAQGAGVRATAPGVRARAAVLALARVVALVVVPVAALAVVPATAAAVAATPTSTPPEGKDGAAGCRPGSRRASVVSRARLRRGRFGLKQLADSLHDGENLVREAGNRGDRTADPTDGVSAFLDFGRCLPWLVVRVLEGGRRCSRPDSQLHQHAAEPRRPLRQGLALRRGAPQQLGGRCALLLDEFPGLWEAGEDVGNPVPRAPEEGTRLADPGTDGFEPQRRLFRFLEQSEQVAFAHRRNG